VQAWADAFEAEYPAADGLAGVDAARVRQWLFARAVQESICSPLMRQVARRLAPQ